MTERFVRVELDTYIDLVDRASNANWQFGRCGGGRLVPVGFMCPHCGRDPGLTRDGEQRCGAPMRKRRAEVWKVLGKKVPLE